MAITTFQIPELTQLVIDYATLKDGKALMMSCRALFSALVPFVWRSVCGASQVFNLIPGTKVQVDRTPNLVTVRLPSLITEILLDRVRFYAQFIQHIEVFEHDDYDYAIHHWKTLLGHTEHSPLLPNLVSVTVNNRDWCRSTTHAQLPWMMMFLHPSLLEFQVLGGDENCLPTTSIDRVTTLLDLLRWRCPHLHTLRLFPWGRRLYDNEHKPMKPVSGRDAEALCISRFFEASSLRCLSTSSMMIQYAGFSNLANLPQLERLEINLRGLDCSEGLIRLDSSNLFSSLRHLNLYHISDMKTLQRFWRPGLLACKLTSVHLHLGYKFWSLNQTLQLEHMIQLLVAQSPHINILTLDPLREETAYQYPNTMLSLMSRLPLRQLRIVTIPPVRLSQPLKELREVTAPRIRSLDIPTHWVSLQDLEWFARQMPNLEVLKIQIDAIDTTWEQLDTSAPSFLSLMELHVVDARLKEGLASKGCSQIARLLSHVWPNAQIIFGDAVKQKHPDLIGDLGNEMIYAPWYT